MMNYRKRIPIIIFLIVCITAGQGKFPRRIIGGSEAQITQFSHQVSIQKEGISHFCGGSIIDATHILTAAHCAAGTLSNSITVLTGTNNSEDVETGEVHKVSKIVYHEKYSSIPPWKNDIAILTLTDPIQFSPVQQPISLPTKDVPVDAKVFFSGWGDTENEVLNSKYLRMTDLKIVGQEECQSKFELRIYPGHVCTWKDANTSAANYDSGGGLIYGKQIVGIASYIGSEMHPNVFTRVYFYLPWIKRTIRNDADTSKSYLTIFKDAFKSVMKSILY